MSTNEDGKKSDAENEDEEENDEELDEDTEDEDEADDEELDDDGKDDSKGKDSKSKKDSDRKENRDESPADRVARLTRQLARAKTKAGIKSDDEAKPRPKPGELDLTQKTYLKASGIAGSDELKLVSKLMKETGKSVEDLTESKYFQSELKALRDLRASKEATPKGKNRDGGAATSQVEYWLKAGTLPPNTPENKKLREEIVDARRTKARNGNVFTDQPIVK